MFAGPNGSGKSELIKRLQASDLPLGPVINADVLLSNIQSTGFTDLTEYGLSGVEQGDWNSALGAIEELVTRVDKAGAIPRVQIKEDILICNPGDLNPYTAALIADFIRHSLIRQQKSFSFETVMSHPSKLEFMKLAKRKGYKTYLYFIATDDYSINLNRVKNRVRQGGHDVPEAKIKTRYNHSLDLLYTALEAVDRAYILDSSKRKSSVIFEKKNDGKGYVRVKNYPRWFEKYVLEKLSQ